MSNKKDTLFLPGSALISSIKTLSSLGAFGRNVLKKNGVKKIEQKKKYPVILRQKIQDELYQNFGGEPLFFTGFFHDIFDEGREAILQKCLKKINESKGFNLKKTYAYLDFFLKVVEETYSNVLLKAYDLSQKNNPNNFGAFLTKKKQGKYFLKIRHPVKYAEFPKGIFSSTFYLIKIFFDYEFMNKKNKQYEWGYEFAYELNFKKKRSNYQLNIFDTIEEQKINTFKIIYDDLIKKIINVSEMQREKIENISAQLSKYIPPQIHDALFAGKYDTEIKTQRRKLTVFFSDIRNFTSTSENLQPEDLTKYLNEYFSEMTKLAIDHGATIDKYIGDAMMVFFGDPETKGEREDARACVEMALRMQERMGELREKWLNEGFADPFEVRIGINTGYCNVGNFGSDQRLTYTIIGGEVNVAARLESAAEANGILMSYETYAHVQDMVEVEQKEAIKMKGINREIKIYAVEGRKEVVKTKAKVTKAKKPTKKELTEIGKLKEESKRIRQELRVIRGELESIKNCN